MGKPIQAYALGPRALAETVDLVAARLAGVLTRFGWTGPAERVCCWVLRRHPEQAEALLELGLLLLRQSRFSEAIEITRKSSAILPDSPTAAFQFARALHRAGFVDEAAAQYASVLALRPDHDRALVALQALVDRLLRGEQEEALDVVRSVGERLLRPRSGQAVFYARDLGDRLVRQGWRFLAAEPARARPWFETALVLDPLSADALQGLANVSEQLGDIQKAVELLDRLVEHAPDRAGPELNKQRLLVSLANREAPRPRTKAPAPRRAANPFVSTPAAPNQKMLTRAKDLLHTAMEGKLAQKSGELVQQLLKGARASELDDKSNAESLLRRALEMEPDSIPVMLQLARLLLRARRGTDALALLDRILELSPEIVEAIHLRIQALRLQANASKQMGDWREARNAWERLVELVPEDARAQFEVAAAYQHLGEVDAARHALERGLQLQPDNKGAWLMFARLVPPTDAEVAVAAWERLRGLDPASIEAPLQIGRLHLRRSLFAEAEKAFGEVLRRDPEHVEGLSSLSRAVAERDPQAALSLLKNWSARRPELAAPWLAIARFHVSAGEHELAEQAYGKAGAIAPSNAEALLGVARAQTALGARDRAMESWTALLKLLPRAVEPRLQVARILRMNQAPQTEEAFQAVLEIDANNREALRRLAESAGRDRQRTDEAVAYWEKLAEAEPQSPVPVIQCASLLERRGRPLEAEAHYRRALTCGSHRSPGLAALARFLAGRQRWSEAAEVYRQHLLLEPERVEAIVGLGRCQDRLNFLDEARQLYDRALGLQPDNIAALGYRGRLLRALANVDGAIADFQLICDLAPQNAEAWHELVFYLASAEREGEAVAALERAEAALGAQPEILVKLGHAAAAALFEDRAVAYYRRAIEASPESARYHAELGFFYQRQGNVDGAFHKLLDSRELDPSDIAVARALFSVNRLLILLGRDPLAIRRAPRTAGQIMVPEQLYHHLVQTVVREVQPYEAVEGRVIAVSATLAPGGAERQLANTLRGLSQLGRGLHFSLFCISLNPRLRRDFFLPILEGTAVEVSSLEGTVPEEVLWHPEVAPYAELIRQFPPDMIGPIAVWLREFRERRPQVVHAWQDSTNLTAVVAALLAGVPKVVLCCRSVRPDNPRRRLRRFMREAYTAVLGHPVVVLSNNSRAGARDYAEWLALASDRIEVVYNGIDFDRLRASSSETRQAREELGIPAKAQVLGGVFRMSEEKRPLLWLDVAAEVARQDEAVHFVICGDGPMRDEMARYAMALGLADRVHLPGAKSNIGSWYKMMDVVMLTSRHEGLPNVLLEAQSLGIPVVAPDVGGMSEVIEQGVTGWTIRDATANLLAERVLHCLRDEAWREAAVARAPVYVRQHFSIPTMLERNLEIYGLSGGSMNVGAATTDRAQA